MCTGIRFTDTNGSMYFGRNLDWSAPFGESVIATHKGYSNPRCEALGIKPRYATIGVGIEAEGFPLYFDAGNECGLACAGLNFPGYAEYAKVAGSGAGAWAAGGDGGNGGDANSNSASFERTAIPSYAFPMFIVSQFASVDEAAHALDGASITGEAFNSKFGASLLHWMVCDSERCIVVEHTASGMHVYDNGLDVLANQPELPFHLENARNYMSLTPEFPSDVSWREQTLSAWGSGSGMRGLPGDFYSPSRFMRAAYLNAHHPTESGEARNVLRAYRTLQGVAMVLGGAKMASGDFEYTTYTSVFSAPSMTYYYSTYNDPTMRRFPMPSDAGETGVVHVAEAR